MLNFDFTDPASPLNTSLDKMISGMLPHDNFEAKSVGLVLDAVINYIKLNELKLEYYVFISVMLDYMEIRRVHKEFQPVLTREGLEGYLSAELYELVALETLGMKDWLNQKGMKSDLSIEINRQEAAQKLFERVMDKYEECFEMAVPTSEALQQVPILRAAVLGSAARGTLPMQVQVLDQGKWVNRRYYTGSEGWYNYMNEVLIELQKRKESDVEESTSLSPAARVQTMRERFTQLYIPMGKTGWDPYDEQLGFIKNRLTVLVGDESVGKSQSAFTLTAAANTQGLRVLYVFTEDTKENTNMRQTSAYIYAKYKSFVTTNHLAEMLPVDEEMDRLINIAMMEIQENELFIPVPSLRYNTVYSELMSYYDRYQFDVLVVDHSAALADKSGDERKDISSLSYQLREFKKAKPVHVIVISHVAYMAREMVSRGKEVRSSATRGSAVLSQDADDVILLSTTEELDKQGLVGANILKSRKGPKGAKFLLTSYANINTMAYEPQRQGLLEGNQVDAEEALARVVQTHMEDYDEENPPDVKGYLDRLSQDKYVVEQPGYGGGYSGDDEDDELEL